jgi:predicted MPP superfamily phosphohydrolase
MKETLLQVSDLHLEFGSKLDISTWPEATYLALCGDIGVGMSHRPFVEELLASKKYKTIFLLTGNHEYYGKTVEDVDTRWRKFAEEQPEGTFVFLDGTAFHETENFLFAGCTLWTNIDTIEDQAMIQYGMNDYYKIRSIQAFDPREDDFYERLMAFRLADPMSWAQGSPATKLDTFWFTQHVQYLETAVLEAKSLNKKLIVFTHHTPSKVCLSPKHSGTSLDKGYYSNLEGLMNDVYLWGCGHTHNRMDVRINGCRLIMNGRGYVFNGGRDHEMPGFTPKVITLD